MLQNKLSWDEIKEIISKKELHKFGRLEDELERYKEYIESSKKTHGTVFNLMSFILYGKPLNEIYNKNLPFRDPIFRRNDFPYAIEDNVEHYLIWSLTKMTNKKEIIKFIEENVGDKQYVWTVNPHFLQSIPEIFHVHVFVKK